MTIHEAQKYLLLQLSRIYDDRESRTITDWVMDHITKLKKTDRIINKHQKLSETQEADLQNIIEQLMAHKPIHYILQQAWFYGLKFFVNENVLIPRPETEELVKWVIEGAGGQSGVGSQESGGGSQESGVGSRGSGVGSQESGTGNIQILDIGTGSGCIPIALKKNLPDTEIYACDISTNALEVAKRNAADLSVSVNFFQLDFLNVAARQQLPLFDIIVSNPPYISEVEKSEIDLHVVRYEPHLALFVPQDDPMIFYKAISEFGKTHLTNNGTIFLEIHISRAKEAAEIFTSAGYQDIQLKKDMQGNDRMIRVRFEV